jgi:hypothetical protein
MPLRRLTSLLACVAALLACAAPADAVTGGTPAAAGSAPWQVAVVARTSSDQWLCGGTLVTRTLVLTAAHCLVDDSGRVIAPTRAYVLSGDVDLSGEDARFTAVTGVALYPGLRMDTQTGMPSGDVALVRLAAGAPSPAATLAVASASQSDLWAPGAPLRIAGWGLSSADDTDAEEILRVGTVARVADPACAAALGAVFEAATMLCAGTADGAVDTCSGDSGSPIIAPTRANADPAAPSDWRAVGVTSWGDAACGTGRLPGVYARLGAPDLAAFAADDSPVWSPVRPVRTPGPSLPTRATVGDSVTCAPGTWTGDDIDLAYEFRRVAADGTSTLAQYGVSDRYVVRPGDGAGVICIVLARNAGGTAWSQSSTMAVDAAVATSADPVTPSTAPVSQRPDADTPRTDVPVGITIPVGDDTVSGQVVSTRVDRADPRASAARASCARRRCTLSVLVLDAAPSSGIRRVTGTLSWRQRCTRDGRATRCARTARIAFRKGSAGRWTGRTPQLPHGTRATVRILAVDRSGRMQSSPTRLTLRVR